MEKGKFTQSEYKPLLSKLLPPPQWQRPVIILCGIIVGIALTAFHISNASSYLLDDPIVCINCHIMIPHFATWEHSSHRQWATCNDCHVPHDNIFHKYLFKAQDGIRHATIFTLRKEPQVITIREAGIEVVQENCKRCHIKLINPISVANVTGRNYKNGEGMLCWGCHRETPHGRVHSEASTPNARVPGQKQVLPDWLNKLISK
jgi:cytochrome c nitrite reductase small subunit